MRNYVFDYDASTTKHTYLALTSDKEAQMALETKEITSVLKDIANRLITSIDIDDDKVTVEFDQRISLEATGSFLDNVDPLYSDFINKIKNKMLNYVQKIDEVEVKTELKKHPCINRYVKVSSFLIAGTLASSLLINALMPQEESLNTKLKSKLRKVLNKETSSVEVIKTEPLTANLPFQDVIINHSIDNESEELEEVELLDLDETPSLEPLATANLSQTPSLNIEEEVSSKEPTMTTSENVPVETLDEEVVSKPAPEEAISPNLSYEQTLNQTSSNTQAIAEISNNIPVSLEFDNIYNDEKLAQTYANCQTMLDPLIARYGLPSNLTYALVSQESGNLDMRINAGGACGPMQIQVAAQNGEHYVVPVYKDGVKTGEYDDFYAVSRANANDPKYQGKKVLIIEDLNDNFQIGCALLRRCIDKYENVFMAYDAYNKGLYAMANCASADTINYYKTHINDFSWTSIIPSKYGPYYADKNYWANCLKHLALDENGKANITFNDKNGNLITYELTNLKYARQNTL